MIRFIQNISRWFLACLFNMLILSAASCEKNDRAQSSDKNLPNVTGYPVVGTNQSTYYDNYV